MKIEGYYIQYATGYDKDSITESGLEKALSDLPKMDDEHGNFWISVYGLDTDEFVIELDKSLILYGNFGEDENYKVTLGKVEKEGIL